MSAQNPPSPGGPPLAAAVVKADAVFEADVVDAGAGPGAWSGRLAIYQVVTYRPTRLLADRGQRLDGVATVTVHHLIVAGSATADTEPRLRPALVAPGRHVVVLASWSGDRWVGVDEHRGVLPASEAIVAEIRAALPK